MESLLALPHGTELAGDYRIERVLGAGGFGITYLAEETSLHRAVAIKEYFPSDFASREGTTLVRSKSRSLDEDYQWGLERFIEEAQALARFDHGNIVRVFRYFRANNTGYMVLQHEPGGSFKGWLDGLGRPPNQDEMDRIISPLLDALEAIHDRDFLHRDIAPDNIIIRLDGSPVLIDFGSARREVARHARTVSVLVKPGYSPFEQYAQTGKQQGPWTDIYALAATLYHGVTGRRPSDAPSRMSHDDVPSATQAALGRYRPQFLAAIDHGLALGVEQRPQNIAAWRAELFSAVPVPGRGQERGREPVAGGLAPTRKLEDLGVPMPAWHGRRSSEAAATPEPRQPALKAQAKAKPKPKSQAPAAAKVAAPVVAKVPSRQQTPVKVAGREAMQQRMGIEQPEPLAVAVPLAKPLGRSLMALLSDVGANMRAAVPSRGKKPAPAKLKSAEPLQPVLATAQRAAAAAALPPAAAVQVRTMRVKRGRPWWMALRGPAWRMAAVIAVVSAMVFGEQALRREPLALLASVATTTDLSLARSLRGHNGAVAAIAFAPDGKTLASVGSEGVIRIWDARTGETQRSLVGSADTTSLDISDGVIAAGSADGRVRLWKLETGAEIRNFEARSGAVRSVIFGGSSNQVFEGGQDGRIRSFDQRGNSRGVIGEHTQPVLALAFAAVPRLLISGGADRQVKLWDEKRRKLIRSYAGHSEDVEAVAITADGAVLASGSNDHSVVVWDGGSDRALARLDGHTGRVVALTFSPRGQLLASASEDGTIKLWDWSTAKLLHTFEGHVRAVRAIAFPPDGRMLASAGDDDAIRLWNVSVTGYR